MRSSLWISQYFVLGRIYLGFALWITRLTLLWITGLTALWITMLRICGLVDYGRRCGGWLRPHALQAGLVLHASHPADAPLVLTGERREGGQMMQGDAAPCGTTHRDVTTPPLLTHALRE